MSKEKEILFPSEKIGIEEEFRASEGAHIEDHEVRSSVFGYPFYNKERYLAGVRLANNRKVKPKRYDQVIGMVIMVSKSTVKVNINYLNSSPVLPKLSAIMHISDASRDYIRNLDEAYASGDIILATINDSKTLPVQLECKRSETGVIYSTCEECGEEVTKIRRDVLQCNECGHEQRRKTAINYGKVSLRPDY